METESVVIDPMRVRDLTEILRIEKLSFTTPWSKQAFLSEMLDNDRAYYLVAKVNDRPVGYIGVWLIAGEGHITNIAVHPDYRGKGIGRRLMEAIEELAKKRGATRMTLEVRVSNEVAQRLYRKLGYIAAGIRRGLLPGQRRRRHHHVEGHRVVSLCLGIETSCDETAAAVVKDGRTILSSVVASSAELHKVYGGVVPEIASRRHIELILPVVDQALDEAGVSLDDVSLHRCHAGARAGGQPAGGADVRQRAGPGQAHPLHRGEPHRRAHLRQFPRPRGPGASGGLPYRVGWPHGAPLHRGVRQRTGGWGGPGTTPRANASTRSGACWDCRTLRGRRSTAWRWREIPGRTRCPRGLAGEQSFDFSFSGLKTAALQEINRARQRGEEVSLADFAASLMAAVVDVLVDRTIQAALETGVRRVLLSGGVAASRVLRRRMEDACSRHGFSLYVPPISLCTDNAAMIVSAGYFRSLKGERSPLSLNAAPGTPALSFPL